MEDWRPVVGYEDFYEVSNQGNLRALDRTVRTNGGVRTIPAHPKKPRPDKKNGYLESQLCVAGRPKAYPKLHRLVAQAFIPNPHHYPHVNHKNGVKTDNRVENLEWVTAAMNTRHAIQMGLLTYGSRRMPKGELHYNATLDERQVAQIRSLYDNGMASTKELAKLYRMSASAIHGIVSRQRWKHLP